MFELNNCMLFSINVDSATVALSVQGEPCQTVNVVAQFFVEAKILDIEPDSFLQPVPIKVKSLYDFAAVIL